MDTLKTLYKKLWSALIRPQRDPYSSIFLGPKTKPFINSSYKRIDVPLNNAFNEKIYTSVFFACDYVGNMSQSGMYVIYCHTHSGSRMEGLSLLPFLIPQGISLVVFDFRASGKSKGNWVTLGYKESSDVSIIVDFTKRQLKAKRICLWGRSMGAAACFFYLSSSFREQFETKFWAQNSNQENFEDDQINETTKKTENSIRADFKWSSLSFVDCFISDAGFINLRNTITNLVKSKQESIPNWLIQMVASIIDKEIKKKTNVSLNDISPKKFANDIKTPVLLMLGNIF